MVKQIYQKAEVIKDNMAEAWGKIDGLETAYHDMLMRVHRLQSNRVCLGLLTGTDYPGECHPHNCPCTEVKIKEEKDRKKQEERQREEVTKKKEESEKRERERNRREMIIESRKKRFYSRMQQQQRHFSDTVPSVRFVSSGEESDGDDTAAEGSLASAVSAIMLPQTTASTETKKEEGPEDVARNGNHQIEFPYLNLLNTQFPNKNVYNLVQIFPSLHYVMGRRVTKT
jgi:hypothetical protein